MATPDPVLVALRAIRKARGLSATEASRLLGRSPAVVRMYESGTRVPPLTELRRYAALLDFDIALVPLAAEIQGVTQ